MRTSVFIKLYFIHCMVSCGKRTQLFLYRINWASESVRAYVCKELSCRSYGAQLLTTNRMGTKYMSVTLDVFSNEGGHSYKNFTTQEWPLCMPTTEGNFPVFCLLCLFYTSYIDILMYILVNIFLFHFFSPLRHDFNLFPNIVYMFGSLLRFG